MWRDAGMLLEIHAKADKYCRAETACELGGMERSATEFIDTAIVSLRNRLRSCVAAAGGHFEHSV